MINIHEIKTHQNLFLNKVKARKTSEIYTIENLEITVNPNVFPPVTAKVQCANDGYKKRSF